MKSNNLDSDNNNSSCNQKYVVSLHLIQLNPSPSRSSFFRRNKALLISDPLSRGTFTDQIFACCSLMDVSAIFCDFFSFCVLPHPSDLLHILLRSPLSNPVLCLCTFYLLRGKGRECKEGSHMRVMG